MSWIKLRGPDKALDKPMAPHIMLRITFRAVDKASDKITNRGCIDNVWDKLKISS